MMTHERERDKHRCYRKGAGAIERCDCDDCLDADDGYGGEAAELGVVEVVGCFFCG